MPTARGWAAIGAGIGLAAAWWGFGERSLLAAAAFVLLAVAVGVVYVRRIDPTLSLTRHIVPAAIHDGDRAVVALTLRSERRVYHAALVEEVATLGSARFTTDRIDPNVPTVARYEVRCRPRGVYRVGPARITTRDPLGLAERSRSVGAPDRLVVYPRVDPLEGLPLGRGQDPTTQAAKVSFSQTSGEDFYTLREYRHGDDLRRVHWPSSAKRDELMIRQLEIPWTSRALVLLDPRNDRYRGPDAFEQAVRGAASVLRHLYRSGYSPRLWTGPGAVGAPISTATAYDLAMEELATVRTLGGLDLAAAVGRLRRTGMAGGILVVVTGTPDETVGALHRSLGEAFHRSIVLVVDDGNLEGPARLARGGALVVRAAPGDAWTVPWRTTMESAWSTATAG